MFKNSRFKKAIISVLALVMLLSTVVMAANEIYSKKITATYGRIKFSTNGKDITKDLEKKYKTPAFVVDDRSYVPVRAMAELMGLDVKYDDKTHTAIITDTKSEDAKAEITKKDQEIAKRDQEIVRLEAEIARLKKETPQGPNLQDLEKRLNRDYGNYRNLSFDIKLKANNNNIDVEITTNLSNINDENNWNRMTYNDKRYMLEDITNTISKEFTDANITGFIYDSYRRSDLMTFTKNRNSNISISDKGSQGGGRDEDNRRVNKVVEDEFYRQGINDARASSIRRSGNYAVELDIDFSDRYVSEWNRISNRNKETMLDRIAKEVQYDYKDSDVTIGIYIGNRKEGTYTKKYNEDYGRFTR